MPKPPPRPRTQSRGPEYGVQAKVIAMLEKRGWVVRVMHASVYLNGFPDLYCMHKTHGTRWVEVKLPNMVGSKFTDEQRKWFPIMSCNGAPIHILTSDSESEYKKLFQPENWFEYFMLKG